MSCLMPSRSTSLGPWLSLPMERAIILRRWIDLSLPPRERTCKGVGHAAAEMRLSTLSAEVDDADFGRHSGHPHAVKGRLMLLRMLSTACTFSGEAAAHLGGRHRRNGNDSGGGVLGRAVPKVSIAVAVGIGSEGLGKLLRLSFMAFFAAS